MSGDGFRLAALERLRAARVDDRGRDLHAATAALEAARDRLREIEEALESSVTPAPGTGWTGWTGERVEQHRALLRARQETAQADVRRCADALDAARTRWLHARTELAAVATLHERHRRTLAEAARRAEQRELDDLASVRAVHGGGAR